MTKPAGRPRRLPRTPSPRPGRRLRLRPAPAAEAPAPPRLLRRAARWGGWRVLGGIAAVAATLGTAFSAVGALTYTAQTARTAEQGQYTDRFTKAVEQLASDTINIRLGGIYAMERLASDSQRDRGAITEVLSSYVRQRFPEAASPQCVTAAPPIGSSAARLPPDVRAVFTVLGRRTDSDKKATPTDLTGICLSAVTDLRRLNLTYANMSGARLDHQWLHNVNLTGANLFRAGLANARLLGADLTDADLHEADLTDAELGGYMGDGVSEPGELGVYNPATLVRANLTSAELVRVVAPGVDLDHAVLVFADLSSANLRDARLTGADLTSALLRNARLSGADLRNARTTGAGFDGADLTGTIGKP